jgi:hypothetical protein
MDPWSLPAPEPDEPSGWNTLALLGGAAPGAVVPTAVVPGRRGVPSIWPLGLTLSGT